MRFRPSFDCPRFPSSRARFDDPCRSVSACPRITSLEIPSSRDRKIKVKAARKPPIWSVPLKVWTGNKEDDRLSSCRSARREPSGASQPAAPASACRGSNGLCPSSSEPGAVASGAPDHASNPNPSFHRDEQRIRRRQTLDGPPQGHCRHGHPQGQDHCLRIGPVPPFVSVLESRI